MKKCSAESAQREMLLDQEAGRYTVMGIFQTFLYAKFIILSNCFIAFLWCCTDVIGTGVWLKYSTALNILY